MENCDAAPAEHLRECFKKTFSVPALPLKPFSADAEVMRGNVDQVLCVPPMQRRYRLDWSEDLLTWSVDGQVVHSLQGKGNVPDLPQSLRVIFRTAHGAGDGPASQVWVQRMKYTATA